MDLDFHDKFWGIPIVRIILGYTLGKGRDLDDCTISLDTLKWYNYILIDLDLLYIKSLFGHVCVFGKFDIVQWIILNFGIKISFEKSQYEEFLYYIICYYDNSHILELMINHFKLINEVNEYSLLSYACRCGKLKCAQMLVDKFKIKELKYAISSNKLSSVEFENLIKKLNSDNKPYIAQWLLETFGRQYTTSN